ncbi:MAG: SpoIIE family protein phosphatase [Armatimonadetes bacterium]|nr:SpoIIE family protein phosphatase [Armatimonadota bacterium]
MEVGILSSLYEARVESGRIIQLKVGEKIAELLGYPAQTIESDISILLDIVHPNDRNRVSNAFAQLIQGQSFFLQYRIFREDGQMLWVHHSAAPVLDTQGQVAQVVGLIFGASAKPALEFMPQALNELSSSESLLRQFVENMPAAVAMFDNDMRYLVASKRWLTDYSLGDIDIIGRSHYEIFPETPEGWKEVHQRVLAGEIIRSDEDCFTRLDGKPEWIRWELRPWRGESGHIGGLIMYNEIITERKLAEQALRRSEQLLRIIQNSMPAEIAVLDKDGVIIAVNEAWEKFDRENGDPRLEHNGIGINYLDACRNATGEYSDGAAEALDGLLKILNGELSEFQLEYECPTLSRICWFSMRAAPLLGEPGGLVMSHFDMTDRMLVQEALLASEEKYRTLVENMDAIVFRMDPQLMPITIAGNIEKMTGKTIAEILAQPEKWFGSVYAADLKRVLAFLNEMNANHKSNAIEYRVHLPHNEIRWMRAHVKPHFSAEGDLLYYDGVIVDTTEIVEAVERMQQHTTRLATLAEISQYVASSFDIDAITRATVELTSKAADCLCFISYIDPATHSFDAPPVIAGDKELANRLYQALEHTKLSIDAIFGKRGIRPMLNMNPARISAVAKQISREIGSGSNVWMPLYSEGAFCGVISGLRKSKGDKFDGEDLWLFSEIASLLSTTLTNSALYRRQARIAETLQRSLVPMSLDVGILDIATCYFPAVGEAEVGGDFFDIIDFGDGRIGVVVGDVSGKGIEAAIHTAEAKYMLRGYALQNSDPGFVITALNRALCAFTGEFTFVTLAYFLINIPAHQVIYVNAGHEPPLILCRDKRAIEEIFPIGPVLGIREEFNYVSNFTELYSDDLLFCYTDGVTDVPLDGERFGYDRLVARVRESQPNDAQHLLDLVLGDVREFGQGRQPDDQVIVVVGPKA